GEKLSPEAVKQVSKWPSRTEMLSTLMGQVLGPGMTLSGQLLGPGKLLASQVKQKGEEDGRGDE
ncbi:MAG: 50S ribosomal protein L10, partial [Planctomycetota bacterium]